jgi:hypothetical protein
MQPDATRCNVDMSKGSVVQVASLSQHVFLESEVLFDVSIQRRKGIKCRCELKALADPQFQLIKTPEQLLVLVVNFHDSRGGTGVGHTMARSLTLTKSLASNSTIFDIDGVKPSAELSRCDGRPREW